MTQQVQKQSITLNNAMTRSDFMVHIDNMATLATEIAMDRCGMTTYKYVDGVKCFTEKAQDIYNEMFDTFETELVGFGTDVANEQKEICASRQCDSIIIREIEECPIVEFKEFDEQIN